MRNFRKINRIINSFDSEAAPGFKVKKAIPNYEFDYIDPFLMLDHFGPKEHKPGEASGVAEHPHRGFETVTFMFEGYTEHRDSNGNFGLLGPGDVQWMTAGEGIVHSELPPEDFKKKGGVVHGVQLWVNLPSHLKMTKPKYQDLNSAKIPTTELENGNVMIRMIAGSAFGLAGPAVSHTPVTIMHVQIKNNSRIEFEIPETFNSFAYIANGDGFFGEEEVHVKSGQMVVFKREEGKILVKGNDQGNFLNFLFISGEPINESVVSYGPFVMNNQKQIFEAISDYQTGKMGKIEAEFVQN